MHCFYLLGFPGGTSGKNPPANAGDLRDMGSFSGLGRSPGEGNGKPVQYSCLENPFLFVRNNFSFENNLVALFLVPSI